MASGGGGGGGKFPWKLLLWGLLYLLLVQADPQFSPANIAHSLQVFAANVQAGTGGG